MNDVAKSESNLTVSFKVLPTPAGEVARVTLTKDGAEIQLTAEQAISLALQISQRWPSHYSVVCTNCEAIFATATERGHCPKCGSTDLYPRVLQL